MTEPASEILFAAAGLAKSYPGVQALADVDFQLRRGEAHALVGENGAGKSTLAKIVSGLIRPDSGTMLLRGRGFRPAGKADAEQSGIRMVMQELNLIGNLTVAENIFLRHMPNWGGVIRYGQMNAAAAALMAKVGLDGVDPGRAVRTLGVGQQQLVEIVAGLSRRCDLLILDEPTAALTGAETELLFAQIERLKAAGVGIVYISHRLEEIRRVADRITVLRNGKVVATCPAAEPSIDQIIRWMVGRDFSDAAPPKARPIGGPALRVEGLSRGRAVRHVSFTLHRGEILGFAGLMGSGRTETMRAVFAADRPDAGAVYLYGSDRPAKIRSPRDAVSRGIALLTEDRKTQGLLLPLSVRVNVTLANLPPVTWARTWIRSGPERAIADRLARLIALKCRSGEQAARELSGGNQQKLVVARWIYRDCNILLFDEPTRGIDVAAKFEIYRLLSDLAEKGKAVIIVSSDLKELLAICDRIAVMSAGRLAAVFKRGAWTQDKIMAAALSGYASANTEAGAS
ncbi:MAG: sugar ABC transporter ATP-binding protein [Phycisphaerae bacterium]